MILSRRTISTSISPMHDSFQYAEGDKINIENKEMILDETHDRYFLDEYVD